MKRRQLTEGEIEVKRIREVIENIPYGKKAGVGGPLRGEDPRNPTGKGGFGDKPSMHMLVARNTHNIKPGQCTNPYGRGGFAKHGVEKVDRTQRSPEDIEIVKTAREIQDLARRHVPAGIKRLREIIENPASNDMAVIAAYNALADRGYGKATQTNVNANIDADAKPSEIDVNQLDTRITETLKRIERIAGGENKEDKGQEQSSDLRKYN